VGISVESQALVRQAEGKVAGTDANFQAAQSDFDEVLKALGVPCFQLNSRNELSFWFPYDTPKAAKSSFRITARGKMAGGIPLTSAASGKVQLRSFMRPEEAACGRCGTGEFPGGLGPFSPSSFFL